MEETKVKVIIEDKTGYLTTQYFLFAPTLTFRNLSKMMERKYGIAEDIQRWSQDNKAKSPNDTIGEANQLHLFLDTTNRTTYSREEQYHQPKILNRQQLFTGSLTKKWKCGECGFINPSTDQKTCATCGD